MGGSEGSNYFLSGIMLENKIECGVNNNSSSLKAILVHKLSLCGVDKLHPSEGQLCFKRRETRVTKKPLQKRTYWYYNKEPNSTTIENLIVLQ
jgi:hypothetical protein